jgi:drug/metabolite transporter (DMT)-like permease
VTDIAEAIHAPPLGASDRARVAIPFIIVTLIWSSTWLVIRGQLGNVPPPWSVTYRFAIAGLAMLTYARWTGASLRLTRPQHGFAIVYGLNQYAFTYYATYLAEETVTSGLVAVVFALLIVPNALLGWAFLRQGVSRPFLLGSGVAVIGIGLLFAHELHAGAAGRAHVATGIVWAGVAVLFSSISNVMQGTDRAKIVPAASLVAWGMVWGTAFNAVVSTLLYGAPVLPTDPAYWAGTLYLGLVGSAIAFTLYFLVIRAIGPARAAYSGVLTPVLAMTLSTIFEGYRWSPTAVAGAVLVLAGLVFAMWARQSANPAR